LPSALVPHDPRGFTRRTKLGLYEEVQRRWNSSASVSVPRNHLAHLKFDALGSFVPWTVDRVKILFLARPYRSGGARAGSGSPMSLAHLGTLVGSWALSSANYEGLQ
jgi:hypothetical protein